MSFAVRFYTFSKRYNSTKRPSGGTVYNCRVMDDTSIIAPKIVLNIGLTSDPSQYNYCYIAAFDRYYFVKEWYFKAGLWTAHLTVDVLATYKTQIGAASLYILRAAGAYDGAIVDSYYPCKTGAYFDITTITNPYNSTGCYVIGVVNKAGMYGSITYYALSRASMATLVSELIDNIVNVGNGYDLNDASLALQLSIVDPIQYIKSCIWLPVPVSNITSDQTETNLNVYSWTAAGVTAYRISNPSIILRSNVAINKHPDTAARGNYVNVAPYTLANLYMPPFGNIELDTSVLCTASSLDADIYMDAHTGDGSLIITANGIVLNKVDAKVGVPIQLSQVVGDYIGAITSVANGVAGAISGVAAGGAAGIASGIASGIGAIGDAVKAVTPRANTIGSGGNFSILTAKNPELDLQFFRPVDDDITQNGRPLCEIRTINTMSGYLLIQDGDVAIPGTREEGAAIQRMLESGFYYE